jgi:hypothetical protein
MSRMVAAIWDLFPQSFQNNLTSTALAMAMVAS